MILPQILANLAHNVKEAGGEQEGEQGDGQNQHEEILCRWFIICKHLKIPELQLGPLLALDPVLKINQGVVCAFHWQHHHEDFLLEIKLIKRIL